MSENGTVKAAAVVRNYHRAWTGGELSTAMEYVSDDIVCHSPAGDVVGKQAYEQFLGGFARQLTGLTDVAEIDEGDRVALFYHPHTAVGEAPVAELLTVRDGRIVESLLIFDRLPFAQS